MLRPGVMLCRSGVLDVAVAATSYPPRLRVQDEVCLGGDGAMSQLVVLQDDVSGGNPVQKFAAA